MLLRCEGIRKGYDGRDILAGIDLEARSGRITALIGPNGSGKTTLLRILALLERTDRGTITMDGKEVLFGDRDARKKVTMVFQQPILLDRSVEANITFGLNVRRVADYKSRTDSVMDLLGLDKVRHQHASTLSGGEKRRTMIGMAIVLNPPVLMLDESFSNLDPLSVRIVEDALLTIRNSGRTAIIMATHSISRAESHGDYIYFMKDGKIFQEGAPAEIFSQPRCLYTADYTGQKNIFPARIDARDGDSVAILDNGVQISVVTHLKGKVWVNIPPTDILVSAEPLSSSALNAIRGRIIGMGIHGPFVSIEVGADLALEAVVTRRSAEELNLCEGREVFLTWKATSVHVFKEEESV